MDSQNPTTSARTDSLFLAAAAILIAGGMTSFYYFAGDVPAVVRLLGLLAAIGVALALAYRTALGQTVWSFILGSRTELRKVVWPTKQESLQVTLMIAVVVLIMALLLWGLDSSLLWLVKRLTGQG